MIPDDLDRILASEEPLLPSSGFAALVMEQVRETAAPLPPIPFPWRRFLLALAAVSVLAAISGWGIANAMLGRTLAPLQDSHLSRALGGSIASLLGTFLLVRLTLGFTGARR
ncbi:MAG TPA: hypothetical protein VGS07_17265 [Thermoanaerobaculia bacterium]|jgi:hypothetical protein|nr:hypothetical protein [Thermoanaerobaculia bacterium]